MTAQFDHINLNESFQSNSFTAKRQLGQTISIPERDRRVHGARIDSQLRAIWSNIKNHSDERTAIALPTKSGAYIEFRSQAGRDLITQSLESVKKGIRLLNVKSPSEENGSVLATVYVPKGRENEFLKKVQAYNEEETKKGNPKNKNLVESIEDVRIAIVESLWTDLPDELPGNSKKWCEIWLRTEVNNESDQNERETLSNFRTILDSLQIVYKNNSLSFPERAIILAYVDRENLEEIIERSDNVAEFRAGQETASFWVEEKNYDQAEWVKDLLKRLRITQSNIRVCILDSGVTSGHPLLSPLLKSVDCLTIDPTWGVNDHSSGSGHGTPMAGVVAYGDLEKSLLHSKDVDVTHTLCSVKILPPSGQPDTKMELWGEITEQAVGRAELHSPTYNMIFCMAVTAREDHCAGRPSSWSGAVDKIAFGPDGVKKLVIVSGGNVVEETYWKAYPDSNLLQSIRDPAQSWNALTVGAYTDKVLTTDSSYLGHKPLAPAGCLSPFSSTSAMWEKTKWPSKPDVVFEGGNILVSPTGQYDHNHVDYGLLTTSKMFNVSRHFDTINATSAATAKASWMAAKLMFKYPNAWPETIRGLIVHSASWNDNMASQFKLNINRKTDIRKLLRIFGYGSPDMEKALFTTTNSLTYVSEQTIQPYIKKGEKYKTNDMHFYEIPWPKDELLAMENTMVELQITLSYFIEPGPGQIGWKDKYRYQSYGFRFDLNSPLETEREFKQRINAEAVEEEELVNVDSGSDRWQVGKNGRSSGSIHSDRWIGTAAEMASCNLLAIYPKIGWWRERRNLKKFDSSTRYSLLVSLRTPSTDVDLYTPVMNKISAPISIEIQTKGGKER